MLTVRVATVSISSRRKTARISHRFTLVCLRPASTATATGYPARPTATSRRRRDCGKYSISLASVVFISISPVLLHQLSVVRVQQVISATQLPLTHRLALLLRAGVSRPRPGDTGGVSAPVPSEATGPCGLPGARADCGPAGRAAAMWLARPSAPGAARSAARGTVAWRAGWFD